MELIATMWRSNKSKLILMLPPAILIISNVFIFGPATIYSGNISEFDVSLTDMLKYYAVPIAILLLIFLGIGLFLSKKYLSLYISLIFTIGILLWIQGNILVWEYGLLDGQIIDWTKGEWRGWVDSTLWLVLLSFAYFFHKQIDKMAVLVSIVLVCLQATYLGFTSFKQPEIWEGSVSKDYFPPEEIYQFSSKRNVIQFLFDSFQSDVFHEIINEDVDHYYTALDGFTFFKETAGSFPTTYMTIPAILSGLNYKNDIPMPEFNKSTLRGKTICNVLYDNGYDVDLVFPGSHIFKGRFSSAYNLPTPYGGTKHQHKRAKSALLLDLVLFRYTPHFLKKSVYNNQSWLVQRLLRQANELVPFSHKAFLEDLIGNMSVNIKRPVYKYIHLNTTHVPIVMNEDCEYAGRVLPAIRENFKIQDKCALDHFIEFLEKLRSLGVYDNSLIIFQADTGAGLPVKTGNMNSEIGGYYFPYIVGCASPLMAIKPVSSKGALKISNAHAMVTDIPATISSILNLDEEFPGRSVFEIDPNEDRERRYYHYKWRNELWQADFFPRLDEYIIKGSVFDRASWRLGGIYLDPTKGISFRTEKLDFGTDGGVEFLFAGWGHNERSTEEGCTFNWALGRSASVLLSLPKKAVRLTANVKPYVFSRPQTITIAVDGKIIRTWNLSNRWRWQEHSIVIGPDQHRPDVSVVEFIFSQHLDKQGKRPLAVLFESITLSEATP